MYEDAHLEAEYEDRNGGEIDMYDDMEFNSLGYAVDQGECVVHVWVAGMCYVHEEDLASTVESRKAFGENVKCEHCDHVATEGIDF